MNTSTQQTLDRIKAEDEASDKAVDRIHVKMIREFIHDNPDMMPEKGRRKFEEAETIFHHAEGIHSKALKECFLLLRANM